MAESDRRILVSSEQPEPTSEPPAYSEIDQSQPAVGSTGADNQAHFELPPPYSPNVPTPQINCNVCHNPINLEGRLHLHVVKCNMCKEATPIKSAPPDKKYVRCPCNCLLICNISSSRIACPRENCRRIVTLQQVAHVVRAPTIRANCAYCNVVFRVQELSTRNSFIRCPHCRRLSVVGTQLRNRRALMFGIIGLVFLLAGITTTVLTVTLDSGLGVYFVWIGAYLVGILNLLRCAYWCCVKVSHPVHTSPA